MAQMAQQLNQANFTQAQAGAQGDIANTLKAQQGNQSAALQQGALANQASAGLGTLGNQQMQNNIANYGMLTSAGGFEQQQGQNQINAQLAKFNQAFQYPQQQLGMMESSLGMTPYDTGSSGTSNSTTTQTQSNPAAMALGGLQTLGGLFSGGSTSAMSGIMSALGGLSDRSMKTDITKLGKDPKTGLDMHAYRYKGDPKSYPKVVGPMAQDVEKMYPGSTERVGKKGKLAIRHYAGGTPFVAPNMDDAELGSELLEPSGASMFAPPQGAARPAVTAATPADRGSTPRPASTAHGAAWYGSHLPAAGLRHGYAARPRPRSWRHGSRHADAWRSGVATACGAGDRPRKHCYDERPAAVLPRRGQGGWRAWRAAGAASARRRYAAVAQHYRHGGQAPDGAANADSRGVGQWPIILTHRLHYRVRPRRYSQGRTDRRFQPTCQRRCDLGLTVPAFQWVSLFQTLGWLPALPVPSSITRAALLQQN